MRRRGTELLKFCFSQYSPNKQSPLIKLPSFTSAFQGTSPSSNFSSSARNRPTTSTAKDERSLSSSKSRRDSLLEQFRLRKIKGSSKTSEGSPNVSTFPASSSNAQKETEKGLQSEVEPPKEVNFKHLGLSEDLIGALEEIGVIVPSEVQCVGIPAILEGKSVLLSSKSGSGRTLAYLLPLIQVCSNFLLTLFFLLLFELVQGLSLFRIACKILKFGNLVFTFDFGDLYSLDCYFFDLFKYDV